MTYTTLLLASFGGPEGPDEVMPFLERVTAGRGVPRERLESVAEHYLALGGVSPINAQNRALIEALSTELDSRGSDLPIAFGNRNSAPYFAEAITQLRDDGHAEVLALATSAYSSYSGCRQYRENLAAADGGITVRKLRPYYDLPGFALPFAEGIIDALDRLEADGIALGEIAMVFTTHSVPLSMSETSGPIEHRGENELGMYVEQHLAAINAVLSLVTQRREVPAASLAYQSRSGPPTIPWLEPDINDVIEIEASMRKKAVVVVPIGFISDHVEVVWDLDNEARATAESHGMRFERVATPGTHPAFVSGLADLVLSSLDGDTRPQWAGFCSAECCPNARADHPVVEPA